MDKSPVTVAANLRAEIEALEIRHGKRRYSPDLKLRICSYTRDCGRCGQATRSVSIALGIAEATLGRWLSKAPRRLRPMPVVVRKKVAMAEERTICVRGPGGLIVEGLTIDDVAQLMKSVAACSD